MERDNNWQRGAGGSTKTDKPAGPYLSLEEVGQRLGGLKESTVKARIREAGIRPVRPGRTPYLHEDDLEQLIEATRERGFDPTLSAKEQRQKRQLTTRPHRRRQPARAAT